MTSGAACARPGGEAWAFKYGRSANQKKTYANATQAGVVSRKAVANWEKPRNPKWYDSITTSSWVKYREYENRPITARPLIKAGLRKAARQRVSARTNRFKRMKKPSPHSG